MENIPKEIEMEYNLLVCLKFKPQIIFNANTETYFVSIIPISLTNSLFLKIVK